MQSKTTYISTMLSTCVYVFACKPQLKFLNHLTDFHKLGMPLRDQPHTHGLSFLQLSIYENVWDKSDTSAFNSDSPQVMYLTDATKKISYYLGNILCRMSIIMQAM